MRLLDKKLTLKSKTKKYLLNILCFCFLYILLLFYINLKTIFSF